jgi:hypothetical protein
MPKAGAALASFKHMGGVTPSNTKPTQPAIAAAKGYNTNTFWEDFIDFDGIDVNNTRNAGYNFYMTDTASTQGSARTVPANSLSMAIRS